VFVNDELESWLDQRGVGHMLSLPKELELRLGNQVYVYVEKTGLGPWHFSN
jgi:hypothetical protein